MLSGHLKVIPGPVPLPFLVQRAPSAMRREAVVSAGGLKWTSDGTETVVEGSRIKAVHRSESTLVLELVRAAHGPTHLTLGTDSDTEATQWESALKQLMAAPRTASEVSAEAAEIADQDRPTITIELEDGTTRSPELLVVACDPRNLKGILDYASEELEIFDGLENFTFHTTILRVPVPARPVKYGVIFSPEPLDDLSGSFYGFRNETSKQFGHMEAQSLDYNLVTTYQLRRGNDWGPSDFLQALTQQLGTCAWWPYGTSFTVEKHFTTPYFNHFGSAGLKKLFPWKLLNLQGNQNTLYVHATTCFESVLHCWSYANLLVERHDHALPQSKDAPITILGAGVSGLLFALRLKDLGYTQVELLEPLDRYGGKTRTEAIDGPAPVGSQQPTICELGTCYMSPAYDGMVEELKQYLKGNDRFDFTEGNENFRGIVAAGEFPDGFDVGDEDGDGVLDFKDYVILKATSLISSRNNVFSRAAAFADLALDLARYSLVHMEYMGLDMPMPTEPNTKLMETLDGMTLVEFLEKHSLESMLGVLRYTYQVQGYGVLQEIPAYYGLVWITPAVTWAVLRNGVGFEEPGVTAWSKGWGDLWDQIVQKAELQISTNTMAKRITRGIEA